MSRFRLQYLDHEVPVPPGEFLIGRLPECDFKLSGTHVSRKHALLRADDHGITVEDLGSRNGIRVNGEEIIGRFPLVHGDVVQIGLDPIVIVDEELAPASQSVITVRPPAICPDSDSDVADMNAVTNQVRMDALSKREREVFDLMAQGYTHREIAKKLFVSVKTLETHRTRIGEKLGCRNLREIMHSAMVGGMLRSRDG
jgi:DNA-binding CsgD family transcriptional regulator